MAKKALSAKSAEEEPSVEVLDQGPAPLLLRQVPCQRYVVYQLIRGESPALIAERCETLRLTYGDIPFLERLQQSLIFPSPFRPNDVNHTASQQWLRANRVAELFPSPWPAPAETALRLIQRAKAKEVIEVMSLAAASGLQIVQTLERLGIRASEEVVRWAQALFWDVSSMDSTELRMVLRLRRPTPGNQNSTPFMAEQMKQAMYRDPRMLLADMPKGAAAVLIAQGCLGIPLQKLQLKTFYDMLHQVIAMRAMEHATSDHPDASFRLMNTMTAAKSVVDISERIAKPDQAAQQSLQRATILFRNEKLTDISALTGGNHQVSPYLHVAANEPRGAVADGDPSPPEAGRPEKLREKVLLGEVGAEGPRQRPGQPGQGASGAVLPEPPCPHARS